MMKAECYGHNDWSALHKVMTDMLDKRIAQSAAVVFEGVRSAPRISFFHSCAILGREIRKEARAKGAEWIDCEVGQKEPLTYDLFTDMLNQSIALEWGLLLKKRSGSIAEKIRNIPFDQWGIILDAAQEFLPEDIAKKWQAEFERDEVRLYCEFQEELEEKVSEGKFISLDDAELFADLGAGILHERGETSAFNRFPYECARDRIYLHAYTKTILEAIREIEMVYDETRPALIKKLIETAHKSQDVNGAEQHADLFSALWEAQTLINTEAWHQQSLFRRLTTRPASPDPRP